MMVPLRHRIVEQDTIWDRIEHRETPTPPIRLSFIQRLPTRVGVHLSHTRGSAQMVAQRGMTPSLAGT